MTLTAIILTFNEQKHIQACIQSLSFADRVVVFDSFSTDATVQLATEQGAHVVQNRFVNYAQQRNDALQHVAGQTDWVLFVDADERVSPELAQEIHAVIQRDGGEAGYRIPRWNRIVGHQMKATGWYPDYQTRLLKVGASHYDPTIAVHEVVVLAGELGTLQHHLLHFNYDTFALFHAKQARYSIYEAEILFAQGTKPKAWSVVTMPIHHFRWRFITLQGYRDGWMGGYLSVLMAWYEGKKMQHLAKLWRGEATPRQHAK